MGDGDASGSARTSDATDFASADPAFVVEVAGFGVGSTLTTRGASLGTGTGAGNGDSASRTPSLATGLEVPSVLSTLIPTQINASTATVPRTSASVRLFKYCRAGGWGGSSGMISARITNRNVGAVFDLDLTSATEEGAAGCMDVAAASIVRSPRSHAWIAATAGRSLGLLLKHRATISRNGGRRSAGNSTLSASPCGLGGRRRVSASHTVTPSAQTSPAAEQIPSRVSGASYADLAFMPPADSPTARTVSLASLS